MSIPFAIVTSGSRGGGASDALPPPTNGRAPINCYAQNAIFFSFFLHSRFILSIILIEICPKHAKNLLSTPPR